MNELIRSILYYEPPLPAELSMFVRNLIGELLKKDPESRLGFGHFGAERVKEHAFFSFIEWDAVLNRSMRPPFLLDNQGHLESLKDPECRASTLTPPARKIPSELQEEFREFDYTAD
ncbi:hypothetical protein XENTR_v10013729 [Xenopus tropicalis]|nr:hypothetical protein XENTR_v10013729 [Xenopus tropicalis]